VSADNYVPGELAKGRTLVTFDDEDIVDRAARAAGLADHTSRLWVSTSPIDDDPQVVLFVKDDLDLAGIVVDKARAAALVDALTRHFDLGA
jgi:hypothetical protein